MSVKLSVESKIELTFAAMALALAPAVASAQLVRELVPAGADAASFAQSVNASGVVVGITRGDAGDQPAVWTPTPGGGYVANALPLPAGEAYGAANSIGAGGAIAGYTQPLDGSTATATLWTSTGSGYIATPLPAPAGAAATGAYSVNASGQVAGFMTSAADVITAVSWTPNGPGGAYTASTFPIDGRTHSVATAVNDQGDLAGYTTGLGGDLGQAWVNDGAGNYVAKSVVSAGNVSVTSMNVYGTGAGVYDGQFPLVMVYFDGDFYAGNLSTPSVDATGATNAVNNFDALVGNLKDPTTPTPGTEAAIWIPTDTSWDYLNLDQWLDASEPAAGAHWRLLDALSIGDGWLVAGNGLYDPDGAAGPLEASERAFLLDVSTLVVPEPTVFGILVPSLAVTLLARRRRLVVPN
jgi:hypothetical protein